MRVCELVVALCIAFSAGAAPSPISARSVHMWHPAPGAEWVYGEVTVEKSVPGSYFSVICFSCGYCGIQESYDGRKIAIFSVWDPGDPFDFKAKADGVDEKVRTKNLYAGEGVSISRFGGEGTGGRSLMPFDWKVGETCRFAVHARPDGDHRTAFTCYLFRDGAWFRIATFSTLQTKGAHVIKDVCSFVEDFRRNEESRGQVRRARFTNFFAKPVGGEWTAMEDGRFTADRNPSIMTIDAEVVECGFALATGGDTENKNLKLRTVAKTKVGQRPAECAALATAILAGAALVAGADTADKIHIRDPFVVVDREKGCYCLLSSCFAPPGERGNDFFAFLGTGAKIYESKDLVNWSEARQVLTIPDWVGCRALWAPELHQFRGKWYILGTVNGADNRRGTWTFVSENLRGPYRPTGRRPITPTEWLALDGTLWVEDDKPYMVFCHEWVQIGDGEMCYVQMNDDLSAPVGEPRTLFKATDYTASPSKARCLDHVTDGPFLYRSPKSGRLFMTWSNVDAKRQYVVVLSESASGRLSGPWGRHKVIFGKDGGHGMLFRKLDGSLAFALHQPNAVRRERPKFFPVEDDGETLRIVQE